MSRPGLQNLGKLRVAKTPVVSGTERVSVRSRAPHKQSAAFSRLSSWTWTAGRHRSRPLLHRNTRMRNAISSLRYALRQFRHSPVFTVAAVLTLALGIGGTTAIFTLIHAVMLRSLPVSDPARLYRIG